MMGKEGSYLPYQGKDAWSSWSVGLFYSPGQEDGPWEEALQGPSQGR